VIGCSQPIGQDKPIFEFRWLPKLGAKDRLNGDFIWFEIVFKFPERWRHVSPVLPSRR
jgi:hypothetical protein